MLVHPKQAKFGDIILFRPHSFLGFLITALDGSEYSHGAVYLEERYGRHLFIEALTDGGVKLSILDEFAGGDGTGNFDIYRPEWLGLPSVTTNQAMALADRRSYDFGRIRRILGFYLLGIRMPKVRGSRLICTELVNWVWGNRLVEGELVTPRTVYEALTKARNVG